MDIPRGTQATRINVDADSVEQLPGADYADAFSVGSVPGTTAATWAQLTLNGGPQAGRSAFQQLIWHGLLGFELTSSESPNTIAGWTITLDEPDLLVLACDGRLMCGRMTFAVTDRATTWTTAVRHHRVLARTIWAGAQYAHRAIAPRILSRTALALSRS